jgi:hypothetical protein
MALNLLLASFRSMINQQVNDNVADGCFEKHTHLIVMTRVPPVLGKGAVVRGHDVQGSPMANLRCRRPLFLASFSGHAVPSAPPLPS